MIAIKDDLDLHLTTVYFLSFKPKIKGLFNYSFWHWHYAFEQYCYLNYHQILEYQLSRDEEPQGQENGHPMYR